MSVANKLQQIDDKDDKSDKTKEYAAVLLGALESKKREDIETVLSHLSQEGMDVIVVRPLIKAAIEAIQEQKPPLNEELSLFLVNKLSNRIPFEAEDALTRENLADYYINTQEPSLAAQQLRQIKVDSSHRHVEDEEKVRIWLKAAQCYLSYDENVEAETFTNRASQLITHIKNDVLKLRFKECFSMILDYKRKFIEAATNYYTVACDPALPPDTRQTYIDKSCFCAILAKAGPQRSRMLSTLCKDERSTKFAFSSILLNMNQERVVPKSVMKEFENALKDHQRALLADNSTVLEQALVLHNLFAASRLYRNISFDELGSLLEISPERAEKAAANMIAENRIDGFVDQIGGFIHFTHDDSSITQWDAHIQNACTSLNGVLETIAKKYPTILQES